MLKTSKQGVAKAKPGNKPGNKLSMRISEPNIHKGFKASLERHLPNTHKGRAIAPKLIAKTLVETPKLSKL